MRLTLSMTLLGIGAFFWLWGTIWLMSRKSLLYKIHALGVADTLGSTLIVIGLLIKTPEHWATLLLALSFVLFWGTMISFVLARGASSRRVP